MAEKPVNAADELLDHIISEPAEAYVTGVKMRGESKLLKAPGWQILFIWPNTPINKGGTRYVQNSTTKSMG